MPLRPVVCVILCSKAVCRGVEQSCRDPLNKALFSGLIISVRDAGLRHLLCFGDSPVPYQNPAVAGPFFQVKFPVADPALLQ